jgi:signal transduction histidine kinase
MSQPASRGPVKSGGRRVEVRKRAASADPGNSPDGQRIPLPLRSALTAHGAAGHLCSFYESRQEWFALLKAFLEVGILRREKCLCLVSGGSEEFMRKALQAAGARIECAVATRAVDLTTIERAYFKRRGSFTQRTLDYWRMARDHALAQGFSGLRGIIQADRVLRSPAVRASWIAYEYQLTQVLSQRGGAMLCLYNRAVQPAEFVRDVLQAHAVVAHGGLIGENSFYAPPDEYTASGKAGRAADRMLSSLTRQWRHQVASPAVARKLPQNVSRRLSEVLLSMKACARVIRSLATELREHKREQERLERHMDYFTLGQKMTRTGSWAWNVSSGEDSSGSMQAEAARAARAITIRQLMATIAHEVNQPLAALVANAGAARRWLAGHPPRIDKARQSLARIIRDGNRASNVVAHIRALVGSTDTERHPLSLNSIVQEVIALVKTELHRNNITVRADLDENLRSIHCDRVQMQQVLLNLIVNAIEAMSTVETRSRLLAVTTVSGVAGVLVSVADRGVGLDEQDLERVFEPFYTTKPRGMGIGLAISRAIIEAHGGRLWAMPNKASGTTFRFQLPFNGVHAG